MHKQLAAQSLGVSTRTLERYVRDGKLSVHHVPGRTRSIPTYREDEIAALKLQLAGEESRSVRTTSTASEPSAHLSFRLRPDDLERLNAQASAHDMSAGSYARQLVLSSLADGETIRLRADLEELQQMIRMLGHDLGSAVIALLMLAGQVDDEAEACAWVRSNLKTSQKG